jgi:phosphoribosylformylglycinamidine (FGAM) synthase-like enzyme
VLFSVIAKIDDVRKAVTLDAKRAGARVYLLGVTRDELGASEVLRVLGLGRGGEVPTVEPGETLPLYRKLQAAIEQELVQSCHSPAKGGLAAAFARIAMASELGLDVDLDKERHTAGLDAAHALFSESNGRFVVTVDPGKAGAFEAAMEGAPCACIGEVTASPQLRIRHGGVVRVDAEIKVLKASWKETLDAI